ncbi:hypothetical protein HK098_008182, partial [Nowakowskiella sp. JEL0407]
MQKVMLGFFRDMDELWEKVADALKINPVYVLDQDQLILDSEHISDQQSAPKATTGPKKNAYQKEKLPKDHKNPPANPKTSRKRASE